MFLVNRFRATPSPLSVIAANAWSLHENPDPGVREETRLREGLHQARRRSAHSPLKGGGYSLRARLWIIIGVALLAWAIVAIPAFLLFG